jgi:hypothetical protein
MILHNINSHTHDNKTLLDTLISSGDGTQFLANDGSYKKITGGGSDNFTVKNSSSDTTAGYLSSKLVAGSNITLTTNNTGENETLTISSTGGGGGGGGDTLNLETLSANKTLLATDANIQMLDPNGANRIITLPTSGLTAGQSFTFTNTANYDTEYYLDLYHGFDGTLEYLYPGVTTKYIWTGSTWYQAQKSCGSGVTISSTILGILQEPLQIIQLL